MKKILGLDIGTNSIGWAFIESNAYENPEILDGKIIQLGSRIIPMDADAMSKFETGSPISKAAGRRQSRGARRLNQRYKLRRTRLIVALKILKWIPESFPLEFKKLKKHNINTYLPFSDSLKKEVAQFFGIVGRKTTKDEGYEISEDWIIYFLKTKAMHEQVNLPELARILYHYNQRRGFKSSRKDAKTEDEETQQKKQEEWVDILKITKIEAKNKGEGKDKDFTFFEITCKSPDIEFKAIKKRINPPDWLNKSIEFRITKKVNKDGNTTYNIYDIDPNAWQSRKTALEKDIIKDELTISEYYLKNIKEIQSYPIKQRIVDRKFYQDEFKLIWEKQSQFYQKEFNDETKIDEIADDFYTHNKEKNKEIKGKDLLHLFFNDIIYYQRGLKSQKGLLANCQYETKSYKTKDSETKKVGVKVTSRSSPSFQEFRIWQTIHNLKLIKKEDSNNGKLRMNVDVTTQYITPENKEKLFDLFDSSSEVSHDSILKLFGFKKEKIENGEKTFDYKLNYPDDKNFIGNETKALFRKVFKKHNFIEKGEKYLNNKELFNQLWNIVYSLPEENDIISALNNKKYFDLPDTLIKHISKLPEFKSKYASLSTKAINKLLPLMRVGKYWNETDVNKLLEKSEQYKDFNKTIEDESIPESLRNEILKRNFRDIYDFNGLSTFIATYIIYGRHSERENEEKYETIDDFKIKEIIPYNSLRNPVVEKIIRETLSLVKDIWANENLGRPDYIHVELGREMKNNNKDREDIYNSNQKNKIEKDRVANLLKELNYANFNADSPADIDKFRIWKDNGGQEGEEIFDTLFKKSNAEFVKDADIEKYRHWAEQNYRSPYTGKAIPLSELFTEKYQIDHIIPRAKFYDDSFGNKVVVEAEVNALKDNRLAIQFIEEYQGREINLSNGKKITVFTLEDYKDFAENVFINKKKKRHLKLYEVPEDFVERQMNDTKYISKTVAQFLRPIAVGNDTDEGVVYSSGNITSDLKNKWGLNKLWKEILKPRFERLEGILGEPLIVPSETKEGDYHFAKDYKRVDHRHHALDALVIACTSRSHIKYLNSLSSFSNNKKDIIEYNLWAKWKYLLNKKKKLENQESGMTEFGTPWERFHLDAKEGIESIIVSHKPTSKLISKAVNKYQKWIEIEEGKWEKKNIFQTAPKDDDKYWVAVRQSLFALPLGTVTQPEYKKNIDLKKAVQAQIAFNIREKFEWNSEDWRIAKKDIRKRLNEILFKLNNEEKIIIKYLNDNPLKDEDGNVIEKIDLLRFVKYASKRRTIDDKFTEDVIKKMPNSGLENNWLTNLLKQHLIEYKNLPALAFKGEGLEQLYKKAPYPINKVTVMDGEAKNKISLRNYLLEGVAGVNQYYLIEIRNELDKKTGVDKIVRKYTTPPYLDCIERLAKGLNIHDEIPGTKYIVLSPGDLVYVPNEGENINQIDWTNKKQIAPKIYLMKSADGMFVPNNIAKPIVPYSRKEKTKGEIDWNDKSDKTLDTNQLIRENFVKLKVDRLGNISPIIL
jgi:CRISPR-associated endonuclease Csn1